ncbi:MAG: transposase [Anaerolineae bacterium]|nr:transposase [Anaerolineae bacterium]
MPTQVLIIDPDIGFMVGIKQALEATGEFTVSVSATGEAAVDALQRATHDVAVVAFGISDVEPGRLIGELRRLQPNLPVVVCPKNQREREYARQLDVQGDIDKPYTARNLVPFIRNASDIAAGPADDFVAPQMPAALRHLMDSGTPSKQPAKQPSHILDQADLDRLFEDFGFASENGDLSATQFLNRVRQGSGAVEDQSFSDEPDYPPAEAFSDEAANAEVVSFEEPYITPPDAPDRAAILAEFEALEASQTDQLQREPYGTAPLPPLDGAPEEPYGTALLPPLDDENAAQTRRLDDDAYEKSTEMFPAQGSGTVRFHDEADSAETAMLDDDLATAPTQGLVNTDMLDELIARHGWTARDTPPPSQILAKLASEPPPQPGDTPTVPTQDLPGVRQFLATDHGHTDAEAFGEVLDAVAQSPIDERERSPDDQAFHDLVDSMRPVDDSGAQYNGLDDLLVSIARDVSETEAEFYSAGTSDVLDQVLDVIRYGTGLLSLPDESEDDSAEMDDSTIADAISGLFDPAFESVLAALAGEQVDDDFEETTYGTNEREGGLDMLTPLSADQFFMDDLDITAAEDSPSWLLAYESEGIEPPVTARDRPDDQAPGDLLPFPEPPVSAEDSSSYPATAALSAVSGDEEKFSLDDLLHSLEGDLPLSTARRPNLKPLPSWGQDALGGAVSADSRDIEAMFDRFEGASLVETPSEVPGADLPDDFELVETEVMVDVPRVSADDTRPSETFVVTQETPSEPAYGEGVTADVTPDDDDDNLEELLEKVDAYLAREDGHADRQAEDEQVEAEFDELFGAFEESTGQARDAGAQPDEPEPPAEALSVRDQENMPGESSLTEPADLDMLLDDMQPDDTPVDLSELLAQDYEFEPPERDAIDLGQLFEEAGDDLPEEDADDFTFELPDDDGESQGDMLTLSDLLAMADMPVEADDVDMDGADAAGAYGESVDHSLFRAQIEEAFYAGIQQERSAGDDDVPVVGLGVDEPVDDLVSDLASELASGLGGDYDELAAMPPADSDTFEVESAPEDEPVYAEDDAVEVYDAVYDDVYDAETYALEDSIPEGELEDEDTQRAHLLIEEDLIEVSAEEAALMITGQMPAVDLPADESGEADEAESAGEPVAPVDEDDDEVLAQAAVQLTQFSLESSAQAIMLSRQGRVLAHAGDLLDVARQRLFEIVENAWRSSSGTSGSLIRFIHLPEAGEFLLYSSQVEENMVLSMVFHAGMPVRTIRRQARRLRESLDYVPDGPVSIEAPAPVEAPSAPAVDEDEPEAARTSPSRPTDIRPPDELRAPRGVAQESVSTAESAPQEQEPAAVYTCLWIPYDPKLEMVGDFADALYHWILDVAEDEHWQIEEVDIQPEYITLSVEIPHKVLPAQAVTLFMDETARRSAEVYPDVVHGAPVWTGGYFVVDPPRELSEREIARFITYQRQAQPD